MKAPTVVDTPIEGAKIIIPEVFEDERGFFLESYNEQNFFLSLGIKPQFVQDNHSHSKKNVLRGLHYQLKNSQSKFVRAIRGEIYDVIVDMSESSKTFGMWFACVLSETNKKCLFVPSHCAHGFLVVSQSADVLYKATNYYDPSSERCLKWDDPTVKISWPLKNSPLLSQKDAKGKPFQECDYFP